MAFFYIQKRASTKTGWRLMKEQTKDGKRSQNAVPKAAWPALGFTDSMSLDEARARSSNLNKLNSIDRKETNAIASIAARVERDRLHHSAFVPEDLNLQFLNWLEKILTGSKDHEERMKRQWATTKRMIITLQLTPEKYADHRRQIYKYLSSQEYSLDYVKKLIRTLNLYGQFCSKLIGKFYEPVPNPRGHDRELINDAYLDSASYFGPSDPLTPDLLAELQTALKPEQYRWLFASMWLGLRPSELDAILADRHAKVWRVEPQEPEILWVYQPKLTSKPRHLRWKPIPILFDEQKEALGILYTGGAEAPLTKTIKRHLGAHVTKYGGRKAFTDLMLDRGQKLEDISQWLGHTSIEMTWKRYKDRTKVRFISTK